MEHYKDYCAMGECAAPDDAPRTHPRKRRVRAVCPSCGKKVALRADGTFFQHWKWAIDAGVNW